jgi:hypothetical protein
MVRVAGCLRRIVMHGRAAFVSAVLVLAACGGGSPDDAAKSLASAAAGASLVAGLRARGAVTAVYARQVADGLRGEASKEAESLRKPDAGPGTAGALRDAARLDALFGEMRRAIDGDDGAALRRQAAEAHALSQSLTAAAAKLGGGGG